MLTNMNLKNELDSFRECLLWRIILHHHFRPRIVYFNMDQRSRTITLIVFVAVFISACVFTCHGILSGPLSTEHPEKNVCVYSVGRTDLLINLAYGIVQQVQIQKLDGTIVATLPGCGAHECNYSLLHYEHGKYHVTVLSAEGNFAGDITWDPSKANRHK